MAIKEMKYEPNFKNAEVLAHDSYKGYEYVVVSYGVHPCAYIAIQEGQPYFDVTCYEDVGINCHGGCTWVEWGLHNIIDKNYKVIGWDYGHYNDFSGTYVSRGTLYITVIRNGLQKKLSQSVKV